MENIKTRYGVLKDIITLETYEDGSIKECTFHKANILDTPYGQLIPQYENHGVRRKFARSAAFYRNGSLKSISLQQQTPIKTPAGSFPAELVTFYENGNIKRLFPLNGKISGYWTEEDEYALAEEFEFSFKFADFRRKVIGIYFYENTAIKSITFWPGDSITVQTPIGEVEGRVGIALYPDGSLKSMEPARPRPVETPIGTIMAYNIDTIGIHGDMNSLSFYQDGRLKGLVSSSDKVLVEDKWGKTHPYKPSFKPSLLHEGKFSIEPLCIYFSQGRVQLGSDGENSFDIEGNSFIIKPFARVPEGKCVECSGCTGCG